MTKTPRTADVLLRCKTKDEQLEGLCDLAKELELEAPTKINLAIANVEELLAGYQNPGTYQDTEYYIRAAAKADILEDVLCYLK